MGPTVKSSCRGGGGGGGKALNIAKKYLGISTGTGYLLCLSDNDNVHMGGG